MDKGARPFLGQFEHGMDDKNRLFLPARYRETGSAFVLVRGFEQCILLLPPTAWAQFANRLETLPLNDKTAERAVRRTVLASATEAEADSQGRILLPPNLRDHAKIRHSVVVIGLLSHAEIWARELWTKYQSSAQKAFTKAAPHLEL